MLNSQSNNILTSITASLGAYLNIPTILYENYRQDVNDLDSRKDIVFARVSVYELPENVTEVIDQGIAATSEQSYGIDITVVRGYIRDDSSRGEFPVNAIKDKIVEWSKQVDASAVTNGYIYTFGFRSTSEYIRDNRTVTRTLTFSAIRDLLKNQTEQ